MSTRDRRAAMVLSVLLAGLISCGLGRPTGYREVGVHVGLTLGECLTVTDDRDRDGIDDVCELRIAGAFAPLLVVDRRDCSWNGRRLAGGYLFAVQRGPEPSAFRIAYLPAYFRDCGWTGLPCATRGPGCSAHPGDSELIAVEARPTDIGGAWRAEALFLSAHCLGRSAGRCRWYDGDRLSDFTWAETPRGAPRIWVARGKHANYASARECDSGHWYYDSCDGNDVAYRFPIVTSRQNIGSRRYPIPARTGGAGCRTADELPLGDAGAERETTECFWDASTPFRGWQRTVGRGATAYARVLAAVGF